MAFDGTQDDVRPSFYTALTQYFLPTSQALFVATLLTWDVSSGLSVPNPSKGRCLLDKNVKFDALM
jgi:hypothetical protein